MVDLYYKHDDLEFGVHPRYITLPRLPSDPEWQCGETRATIDVVLFRVIPGQKRAWQIGVGQEDGWLIHKGGLRGCTPLEVYSLVGRIGELPTIPALIVAGMPDRIGVAGPEASALDVHLEMLDNPPSVRAAFTTMVGGFADWQRGLATKDKTDCSIWVAYAFEQVE
jgi:hypothetical protein